MKIDSLFNSIPKNWKIIPLGEICKQSGGEIQIGPFGSQLHAADYVVEGIPSIMPQNIGDNHINTTDIARVSAEDVKRLKKHIVQEGDIVYSRRGDITRRALIQENESGWLCGTGCIRIRPGKDVLDPAFTFYYLGHPKVRNWIASHAVGATMPNLNTSILAEIPFLLPPLGEQRQIAKSCQLLDRKISNLRQQNETLEKIAQTLFKHWFVDFEFPNEDGKPYKSSGGEMVRSELGEIPAGWRIGKLDDVLTLIIDYRGKTPKKLGSDWSLTGIPALSAKNIKGGQIVREDSINFVDEDLYKKWMKDELQKGDVLLTSEAPLGEVFYLANDRKYVLSQRLFSLRTKARFNSTYLYFWLKSTQGQFLLERRATGSTVEGIRQVELRKVEVIIPPADILEKATRLWLVALEKTQVNSQQIQTLTKTRDVLLPQLMSGKLRITGD